MIKMEEKLKTLKDLRKILVWPERKALSLFELKQTNAIIEKDIRQEAIKWIKFLDTDEHYDTDFAYDPYEVIPFIKHFFNIENKDLE